MQVGYLGLSGWAGDRWRKVEIIGETPKKYRIRAIEKTKLAGRCRWLEPGQTALVPKYAIRLEEVNQHAANSRPTTEETCH